MNDVKEIGLLIVGLFLITASFFFLMPIVVYYLEQWVRYWQ